MGSSEWGDALYCSITIEEESELKKPIGYDRPTSLIKIVKEMPKIIKNNKE